MHIYNMLNKSCKVSRHPRHPNVIAICNFRCNPGDKYLDYCLSYIWNNFAL